jgi:hypothetical protein
MKKLLFFKLMAAGVLFFSPQAHAAAALELSGTDYDMFLFCLDDVGDYCAREHIKTDAFLFDGDRFSILSFEDDLWGLAGDGDYSSSGLTFDASYTAIKGPATYSFKITGLILVEAILLGKMDIAFEELDFLNTNKEKGSAFFLGIKN